MPRLFVTRPLPVDAAAEVGPGIEVEVFPHERPPTRAELLAGASRADGLVALLTDTIDAELLDATRLKVVANVAVGVNHVDLAAARARRVWVTNTPDVLTEATADLTWALLLAVARRLREGERVVREGRFGAWSLTMLLGLELSGTTLGIVGLGRIGRAVARRALGFGMRVTYAGRSPAPPEVEAALGARRLPLPELLAGADVVTLHCPLTPETRHLIDAAALARMKPGALLLNTARGPVVDEAALVAALEAGRLGGAGLDVYEHEPQVHPGLLGRDDVVLLPHIGSATRATREKMARMALGDAARVLRGQRPLFPVVDPEEA